MAFRLFSLPHCYYSHNWFSESMIWSSELLVGSSKQSCDLLVVSASLMGADSTAHIMVISLVRHYS